MGIGELCSGGNMDLYDKRLSEEATAKNYGVCHREMDLRNMYMRG